MPKKSEKPWWWYKKQEKKTARQQLEPEQQPEQQPKGILSPAVEQIFGRHLIHDNIFIYLSAMSLARMAMVSRDVRAATLDFTVRAYNLNRRLSHFFHDPLSFRALMQRTRVIISWSFALQFLDRSFYPEADLDLYVRTEGSHREIGLWLQATGYAFKPSSEQAESFLEEAAELDEEWTDYGHLRCPSAVYTFERRVPNPDPDVIDTRKVQIIVPPPNGPDPNNKYSLIDVVMRYHSTCVMNFITHDTAYSLYPYATFEKRCALVFIDDDRSKCALAKYAARGFKMLNYDVNFWRKCPCGAYKDSFCSPGFLIGCSSKVGDRFTWTMPLDRVGGSPGNAARSPPQSDLSSAVRWTRSSGLYRCWKVFEYGSSLTSTTRFRVKS
ncbi:hypothetical protein L226DRAFT_246104 [Lentinus tigrinus ALCF2SS1-7]|uniref:F-box domain-containing protein n=1 Tax=Lentinus tigrinus ALCF2SS1-6 TaxID=1328759 RepID=A0A5C2SQC8_9APHY|nr:hypothetical protein L227DRAFT_560117 [Lentinus tigrinus ALCF2SS1-6]RPD79292.1 hypothetical protein L226DRAFT_246104 [Lentinus tigrinus ALCF2SS1-7]